MASYSLSGYLIALTVRSKKTIVVEGPHDKEFLDRILAESPERVAKVVVDTAEILGGSDFTEMGARGKLDKLIGSLHPTHSAQSRIGALLDREWEGLLDDEGACGEWSAPEQTPPRFLTLGHSLENYAFDPECVVAYLKFGFPDLVSDAAILRIHAVMPKVLTFAAAFSDVCRRHGILGKCGDIMGIDDVSFDGDNIAISGDFTEKLVQRGVNNAPSVVQDTMEVFQERCSVLGEGREQQFLTHGHLGEMIVWLCCGKVLQQCGILTQRCVEFAFGRRNERRRFCHTWMATIVPPRREPIDKLIDSVLAA